jgi:hypothetical protein
MSTQGIGSGSGPIKRGILDKAAKAAEPAKVEKPGTTRALDVFERAPVASSLLAAAAPKPAIVPEVGAKLKGGDPAGGNIAAAFDVEELASLKPGDGSVRTGNIAAAFDIEELTSLKPGDGSVRTGNIAAAFDIEELASLKPGDGSVRAGNIAAAFDVEELTSLKPGDGSVRAGNIAAAFDIEELINLKPDTTTSPAPERVGVPSGVTRKT